MKIRLGSICVAAIVSSLVPLCSYAQQYNLVAIPGIAGTYTEATGINSSGQVVGNMRSLTGSWSRAFVTKSSTNLAIELGTLGSNQALGAAINDSGSVAGESFVTYPSAGYAFVTDPVSQVLTALGTVCCSTGQGINSSGKVTGATTIFGSAAAPHAFITNAVTNEMIDLGTLGGRLSLGYGINSIGQVTGISDTTGNISRHAFVTNASTNAMFDLGTLGGVRSYGLAINDSGQVTGLSETASMRVHAFITDSITGAMVDIGALGGNDWSAGYGINSMGEVVGQADISTNSSAVLMIGFLYSNGTMVDLNSLMSASDQSTYTIIQAKGINDKSQIAATATVLATGQRVAVLLSPANIAPTVQPTYAGTAGTNGWYRSAVTLSWNVAGLPAPTTVGCGTTTVTADTKGRVFTCTATNSVGTATQSVTVKVDKLSPVATITSPQASTQKTYSRNHVVSAKYTCSDLTSGVASCVGSVANGARVSTTTPGTYSFVVTATDKAGNTSTKTVVYRVR